MRAGGAAPAHGQKRPGQHALRDQYQPRNRLRVHDQDEGLAMERVLDDQAEIVLGERSFPQ
jgi:hypothetical protein